MALSTKWFTSEQFAKTIITIGTILIVLLLFLFCYKNNLFEFNTTIKTEEFGQFGDAIGGVVGSFWALAGVILFYTGLVEQRNELVTSRESLKKQIEALEMQRHELKLQREEYEKTREIFKDQSRTIHQQQFEANFYSLLKVYMKIRDNLLDNNNIFETVKISSIEQYKQPKEIKYSQIQINKTYIRCFIEYEEYLSQYFKVIHRVFKTIENGLQVELDKYKYAKIVRSQFLETELFLLYYFSHSALISGFNSTSLKYNLFKHLPLHTKLGFTKFRQQCPNQHFQRWHLILWLDTFLSRLNEYDEILLEGDITFNDKCPHIDNLFVSVTQNENLSIEFHFLGAGSHSDLLDTKELFIEFIELYLLDRFFFTRYEMVESSDEIQCHEKEYNSNQIFKFTIISDKSFRLNSDTI